MAPAATVLKLVPDTNTITLLKNTGLQNFRASVFFIQLTILTSQPLPIEVSEYKYP